MARSRSRSISRSRSRSPVRLADSEPPKQEESSCPFLIRLFVSKGRHTPMQDFDQGLIPVRDEFSAYGWKSSTPTSLISLLMPSFPPQYRSHIARFSFRHIYVDATARGLYRHRDLVSFTGRDLMASALSESQTQARTGGMDMELDDIPDSSVGKKGKKVDEKTLEGYGFVTGDLISVSVHVPEPKVLVRPTGTVREPRGEQRDQREQQTSYGWGDKREPLPPQSFGRAEREPAGGGNWRGGAPGVSRGGGRRSRSPPPHLARNGDARGGRRSRSPIERNGRDRRDVRDERDGRDARDRRESWGRR